MQFPTVHLNGTTKKELDTQLCRALAALQDARREMINAEPHGRDYPSRTNSDYTIARAEHVLRLEKIEAIITEYAQIRESLHGVKS